MARFFATTESEAADGHPADPLYVNDIPFSNAASKFWTSLVDEASRLFEAGPVIEMTAPCVIPLRRRLLFPNILTEEDLADAAGANPSAVMADTLAAIEMLGPPPSVTLSVLRDGRRVHEQTVPEETLDSETFPYLLVWLLEWSGIAPGQWNRSRLRGAFRGEDRKHRRLFAVNFNLKRRHLSEGLFALTLALRGDVGPTG